MCAAQLCAACPHRAVDGKPLLVSNVKKLEDALVVSGACQLTSYLATRHSMAHPGLTGCGARLAPPADDPPLMPSLHPWLPLSLSSQAMEFNYFEEVWAAQQELFQVFSQEAMVRVE